MANKLKFIVAASIVVLILLAGSPSQIHLRDKLGPSSATAKSRKLPLLAPQHRGIPPLLRRQLPSPVAKVTLTRLLNSEGSSADIFEAKMPGKEALVAVKVYRNPWKGDWVHIVHYFLQEIEGVQLFDRLQVGPRYYGVVDVGGNPAYAMELINGVDPELLGTMDVLELITQEKIEGAIEIAGRIRKAGYVVGDPQILVVTRSGYGRQRGDIIFVDSGSVRSLSEKQSYPDVVRIQFIWAAESFVRHTLTTARGKALAEFDNIVTLASFPRRLDVSL